MGAGRAFRYPGAKGSPSRIAFSNSKALLEAASPKLAVISYEKGNSYGHPHQETLKRLEEAGVRVLGTGEKGAVFMHIEEGRLSCRTYLP